MTPARRLLDQLCEQRTADARIDALKQSWTTPLRSLLPLVPVLASQLWLLFDERLMPRSTTLKIGVSILAFACVAEILRAWRARERLWREVVAREAPQLHARLLARDL